MSVSSAFSWSFANALTARLGTLAIGVVLARVLGPEEFGTYAIAFVALLAVLSFNELGVGLAVVRWTTDPAEIAPTVSTISITTSAVVTGAMMLAAGPFATAMGDPDAAGLVRLLSLCVLINGIVATPAALLQRAFRQKERMIADQVNVWLGAVVSLALALSGAGAISLVVGRLAGSVGSALLLVRFSPLPLRVGLDRSLVRPLLRFGVPLAAASLIVFAIGFVDQLAVGTTLGPVALGFFVLAFNLASWPVTLLSHPLRAVAPAMFARLQHDPDALTSSFHRVVRPLAAVALPACLLLAVAAPDVVRLVYGSAWLPAAEPLRWLAVAAALRILFELVYDYVVVLRRTRAILGIQVAWLLVLTPTVVVAVRAGGTEGAALAVAGVAAGVVLPLHLALLARVGVDLRAVARDTVPAVVVSALVVGGVLAVAAVTPGPLVVLAAAGLLGGLASGLLLWRDRGRLVRT